MAEFGSPSQVLRMLVQNTAKDDITTPSFGVAAEEMRRAAEFERQIDSLDQKEMELHQTQLKLIREQTATFIRDLNSLKQEVKGIAMRQDNLSAEFLASVDVKHREFRLLFEKDYKDRDAAHEALHARLLSLERDLPGHRSGLNELKLLVQDMPLSLRDMKAALDRESEERAANHGRLERRCAELGGGVGLHTEIREDFDRKLALQKKHTEDLIAEHRDSLSKLHSSVGKLDFHHGPINDRLDNLLKDVEVMVAKQMSSVESGMRELRAMIPGDRMVAERDWRAQHGTLSERLEGLEKQFAESVGSVKQQGLHHTSMVERVDFLEKVLGDSAERHRTELEAAHKKLDLLHSKVLQHGSQLTNHASMQERMQYLEQLMGDSADKHAAELASAHAKLQDVHGRVAACERQGYVVSDLQKDRATREQHHASLQERVDYLEQAFGDSADKHAAELASLKAAHDKHLTAFSRTAKDVEQVKGTQARHATVEERLSNLERICGDSAESHGEELSSLKVSHDRLHSRLTACEAQGTSHGKSVATLANEKKNLMAAVSATKDRIEGLETAHGDHGERLEALRAAHDKHATGLSKQVKDLDAFKSAHAKHATLGERVDYLEKLMGDNADRHIEEIRGAKAQLDRMHSRVAACEKFGSSVDDLRKSHDRLSKDKQELVNNHSGVQERLDYLERLLGDSAAKHASELADLKAAHDKHATAMSKQAKDLDAVKGKSVHHATIEERLNYIEQMLGDSADKHSTQLATAQAKLDALHGRVQSVEKVNGALSEMQKTTADLSSGRSSLEAQHASMQDRVNYLEKVLGDSVEKHARELKSLKDAHARHGKDLETVKAGHARHATVDERLDYLEKTMGDSADKHAAELSAAHARLEQLHGRLSSCEANGSTVSELKKSHSSLANHKNDIEVQHASLKDRVDYLEKMLGDSADKHAKLLEAAHAKVDQLHGRLAACERSGSAVGDLKKAHADLASGKTALETRHASLQDRLGYVEQLLGDSLDKHGKELEALKAAHDRHQASMSRHSKDVEALKASGMQHLSMAERLVQLEQALGETGNKHATEIESVSKKAEQLHGKLSEERAQREKHHNTIRELIAKEREQRDTHHMSVKQRVDYLESVMGDNAEKHAKELAETKSVATKIAQDVKAATETRHGSIAERLEGLEKNQGEASCKLAQELRNTHHKIDHMYSRLSVVKDAWTGAESPTSPSMGRPTSPSLGRRNF